MSGRPTHESEAKPPWLFRTWWVQALGILILLRATIDIAREPGLLVIIKVVMVLWFGVGTAMLLVSSVRTFRSTRAVDG